MTKILAGYDFSSVWNDFVTWCTQNGLKALIATLILVIVFVVINLFTKAIRNRMRNANKDENFTNLIFSLSRKGLKILAIIIYLAVLGIDMAAVTSLIAALGVAIGLAVQGALSNVAGWVIIVISRPFKLGDFIETGDIKGTVEEISVIYTHLKTPDNKVIYVPNGSLANNTIANYSKKDTRRVDVEIGISYANDQDKAIEVIKNLIAKNPQIHTKPEPFVKVTSYGDSAVNITAKFWVKKNDYWDIYYDYLNKVRYELEKNGIKFPYNQLDVNLQKIKVEIDKTK